MTQMIEVEERERLQCAAANSTMRSRAPAGVVALLWQRGVLLEQMGRVDEARENWLALLEAEPMHLGALHRLGELLHAAGEGVEARRVFSQAVAGHPDDAMSRVQLAKLLIKDKELEAARGHLEHALSIDANYRPAHAGLAFVLCGLGEPELAAWHGRKAFHGQCVVAANYRGEGTPVTVLELISTRGGNVRIGNFLSDRFFQRYLVTAEFYEPGMTLPAYQLIVNAIGDADVAGAALEGAAALVAHSDAPVINAPGAVMATGRRDVARRLGKIDGVITARTAALRREALARDGERVLTKEGFAFPLLLRSPGFHGGEHFLRVENASEVAGALEALPGDELLVIEYLDSRGVDGKFRKYRAMTVDGRLYPLHCAVSRYWKVHYFSAEMADFAEHRAEDAAFLEDMPRVLGPRAMYALATIQEALGLDYGGIDFGLNARGDLVVFEANATMVILPPDADARWDYRRPAVERVCRAVHGMLMERATPEAAMACEGRGKADPSLGSE